MQAPHVPFKLTLILGALMYGPPGTGKTLLARACAAQTEATFLKLAGPQLVQMFIGDGAKLVRDCFALAKEKAPSIIFIDELDAVGTKRFDSDKSGDREVQRTMLELLNQLDGFASDERIKVLAATNRVDVLDPALLRSGRLDRKIEFPLPNEEARAQILRIHSRKMTVDEGVNWPELARSTDEFGGAQLKAVCVEAGMIALRSGQSKISHEHYVDAISEVQAKKKVSAATTSMRSNLLTTYSRTLSTSMHRCLTSLHASWHFGIASRRINRPSVPYHITHGMLPRGPACPSTHLAVLHNLTQHRSRLCTGREVLSQVQKHSETSSAIVDAPAHSWCHTKHLVLSYALAWCPRQLKSQVCSAKDADNWLLLRLRLNMGFIVL